VLAVKTLAPVADKLGKFIRLLTSNRDGEVVAAARAIVRTLEGVGADIHDLAESIGALPANGKKFSEADAREIYERGVDAGRRAAEQARPPTLHNVDDDGPPWHAIACECAAHLDRLCDQREKDFVADMVRWTTRGGEPTEKQANWLRSIYVRVRW
jgi:hypothetical protein